MTVLDSQANAIDCRNRAPAHHHPRFHLSNGASDRPRIHLKVGASDKPRLYGMRRCLNGTRILVGRRYPSVGQSFYGWRAFRLTIDSRDGSLVPPYRQRALAALVLTITLLSTCLHASDPKAIDFNRDIRPILSNNCFHCHGPDAENREADLRLDVEESMKADLGGYAAVVPGDVGQSELIARIVAEDADERMPPPDAGKQLSPEEIRLLQSWVKNGAVWSRHWAYVPPQRHAISALPDDDWSVNWVDKFILDRLRREGLKPSLDADRATLIRRLNFDLIGLPPKPEDVDRFVSSQNPQAYEELVDRLLESPHFGERMAMYWLDLVRYADTVGYHGDQDHNISPYRDYVIDAFNDDLPFDQFTREQLAGDLLPEAGIDQKIASGYNRLLQTSHEGGVQPKEYLSIYAADRVRNISAVWLGATLGCAQCHDHKYDPYTMKDFYSMAAFFADVDEESHFKTGTNDLPTARPPEIEVLSRRQRTQIDELDRRIAQLGGQLQSGHAAAANETTEHQLTELVARRDAIANNKRKTMITVALQQPRTIRILPRGNWLDDSGPIVQPAVPQFLGAIDATQDRASRLRLADWLTDPAAGVGGLTARVFVNRLWYLCFGSGLAKDLDDFGGQGEPPTHPRLLDNLAIEFTEHDWSVKGLVKLLVMSRTYRQSSVEPEVLRQTDPENRLYARQSRFRLPAEMVRDNALAISGLLVDEYGGASVKPYQPAGYYRHLNFPTRRYTHHADQRQWRRGLYIHWQRQFLHPMLKAFDAPSREECTAQRPRSNTPLSALVLLNDPTFVEAARVFAERIWEAGETTEDRLEFAFRRAVSRSPDADELSLLSELLVASQERYRADRDAAQALLHTGQASVPSGVDIAELAAWSEVARAILNLSESITRN